MCPGYYYVDGQQHICSTKQEPERRRHIGGRGQWKQKQKSGQQLFGCFMSGITFELEKKKGNKQTSGPSEKGNSLS